MSGLDEYLARTPRSRAMFERATRVLPGGSTRTTVFTPPYPPYIVSGEGIRVRDVDGNEYRDFLGNYTSLILGHAHPAVVAAVAGQVSRGSAFAAPTEAEVALAEELCRRLPSVELVRFTNSGTEATMFAIRAARAFTGRSSIATFERSYHGTHDAVMDGVAGVPGHGRRPHDPAAVGRRGRDRGCASRPRARSRRDPGRAGPGCRRDPRGIAVVPRVPAGARRPDRRPARLRRDHLVPAGAGRRPGTAPASGPT